MRGVKSRIGLLIVVAGLGCSFESSSGGGGAELEGSTSTGSTVDPSTTSAGVTTASTTPDTDEQPDTTSTTTSESDGPTETTDESTSTGEEPTTTGPDETTDASSSSSGGETFLLCDDTDDDLRGCYDFADIADGVLPDLSMYGNDGDVGDLGMEAGPFGTAVRPGMNATISIPDSGSLDVVGPASWEAWVLFDSFPGSGRAGVIDNEAQYSLIYNAGQGLRCNGGGVNAIAPNVPMGQWLHVACNFDGDEMSIWLNGNLEDTATGGSPMATANTLPVSLGDTSPSFNETMDGLVGGVRFWSVVRTQKELEAAAAVLD